MAKKKGDPCVHCRYRHGQWRRNPKTGRIRWLCDQCPSMYGAKAWDRKYDSKPERFTY